MPCRSTNLHLAAIHFHCHAAACLASANASETLLSNTTRLHLEVTPVFHRALVARNLSSTIYGIATENVAVSVAQLPQVSAPAVPYCLHHHKRSASRGRMELGHCNWHYTICP